MPIRGLRGCCAYMVAVAATVIAVSRAGDILGRRRVFAYGLVAFGVGPLACGLAPDVPALVAGRIVQGIGGGAVYALSLAVITASRPKDEPARGACWWSPAWRCRSRPAGRRPHHRLRLAGGLPRTSRLSSSRSR